MKHESLPAGGPIASALFGYCPGRDVIDGSRMPNRRRRCSRHGRLDQRIHAGFQGSRGPALHQILCSLLSNLRPWRTRLAVCTGIVRFCIWAPPMRQAHN